MSTTKTLSLDFDNFLVKWVGHILEKMKEIVKFLCQFMTCELVKCQEILIHELFCFGILTESKTHLTLSYGGW